MTKTVGNGCCQRLVSAWDPQTDRVASKKRGKIKRKLLMTAAAAISMICWQPAAQAANYSFSITNTLGGGTAGTVRGEIDGLPNGSGTGKATAIFVRSWPSGLNAFAALTPTTNLVSNATQFNTFTVTNGVISAFNFLTVSSSGYTLQLNSNVNGQDTLTNLTNGRFVTNFGGINGVRFTQLPVTSTALAGDFVTSADAAVPEPGSFALFAAGLGLPGVLTSFRRRMGIRTGHA